MAHYEQSGVLVLKNVDTRNRISLPNCEFQLGFDPTSSAERWNVIT